MDDAAPSWSPQSPASVAPAAPATPGLKTAREAGTLPATEGGRYVAQEVYAKGGALTASFDPWTSGWAARWSSKELLAHGGNEERRFLTPWAPSRIL